MDHQFAVERRQEMFGLLILDHSNFFGTASRSSCNTMLAQEAPCNVDSLRVLTFLQLVVHFHS